MRATYVIAGIILVALLYVGVRAMRVEGFDMEKACQGCPSGTCVDGVAHSSSCYELPPCETGKHNKCCPDGLMCP